MRKFISIALLLAFVICEISAQGIKIYKKDGTVIKYTSAELDYIEAYQDEESQQDPVGHIAVDLGLSVKWASCNIGANSPEQYGDYYAWGEKETKSSYERANYKYYDSSYLLTRYCTMSKYGKVDNKTTLDLQDDVARAKKGGSWRMPTKAEQDELRNKCDWKWTTKKGINGYEVKSRVNGNSIFLPAAGYRQNSSSHVVGSGASYWSSTLSSDQPIDACLLYFNSDSIGEVGNPRDVGFSVRAVCP